MKYPKRAEMTAPRCRPARTGQSSTFVGLGGRCIQQKGRLRSCTRSRNRNIHSIRALGRREWHTYSGYGKRSMVENTVFRYETIIGQSMKSSALSAVVVRGRRAN